MASTPKQANGSLPSNSNGPGTKRKKSRTSKGSYLSKWLDKTMHHIHETTPSSEAYDMFLNPNLNWPMGGSQFAPGFDPHKYNMYGCASEPMSLPTLPTYYNPMVPPPYSDYRYVNNEHKGIQVHRPRQRRRSENKAEELSSTPADALNHNYLQPKNFSDSQDFASLPPIVTSMGDTNSNSDLQTNDKDDGSNARRFSDPCVRGLPDVARAGNGEVESGSEASSGLSGSQVGSRLLSCLLDQISTLKLANDRLNKELLETKAELESVRQHNAYFPKGPGTMGPTTSNLNSNGPLGAQYSPGFLTDLVREIRDAARMREEAMYARVRAMLSERNESGATSTETKLTETLEEIKNSLRAEADKRQMMDRIVKLEEELRVLRLANGYDSNESRLNGSVDEGECERQRLRRELESTRRAKQSAEEHAHKLERLVTQMRSKFNGMQITNRSESLPSDHEHDTRVRRTSNPTSNSTNNLSTNSTNWANTSTNSTVILGPVSTDL